MEAPTAKRGVYPLHGFKLGLYRLPITLEDPDEINVITSYSIHYTKLYDKNAKMGDQR